MMKRVLSTTKMNTALSVKSVVLTTRAKRALTRSSSNNSKDGNNNTASSASASIQETIDWKRKQNRFECKQTPIVIVSVKSQSSEQDKLYQSLEKDFEKKIQRYTKFELVSVAQNPMNAKEIEKQLEGEGERVLRKVDGRKDLVVLVCERGERMGSEQFAREVIGRDHGKQRVVFIIGGPFGHGKDVIERADLRVSVSDMVTNHAIARVFLMEQIYRAWTIIRGEPYHH